MNPCVVANLWPNVIFLAIYFIPLVGQGTGSLVKKIAKIIAGFSPKLVV